MVRKERPRTRRIVLVYALLLALILFGIAGYYYKNQGDVGVRTGLVGDRVCGNIPGEGAQDLCCEKAHEGDVTILCVGNWQYIGEESICRFVCGGEVLENPQEECERVGGEWKTFNNGCVDSCDLARNPELISCAAVLTEGCNCGEDSCWNGESCEPI